MGVRRVFMTADAVGGVWRYAMELAGGLSRRGGEVTLALLGPRATEAQRQEAAAIPGLRLIETGLPLDWTAESAPAVRQAARRIAVLARESAAEVVQVNGAALAAGSAFDMPVVAVQHSCLATWWAAVRGGPLPPGWQWNRELVRRGLDAVDALVAPSRAFADATRRAYDLPRLPIVVHNGRSARPKLKPATGRMLSGVVTAGRLWDEGKNLACLDRAARMLDLPVFAAGPLAGPNGAGYDPQHLYLLGELAPDDLRDFLALRPIYAAPALYEPFGLSVLEAAQAGCALVLAEIPSFRELWADAALFFPPDDHRALAALLQELDREPERRRRLGRRAHERAQIYNPHAMVEGMLAVYRSLLGAPAAEAAADVGTFA